MLNSNNYKSLNMNPKNNDLYLSKTIFTEDTQLKQNNILKTNSNDNNDIALNIQVQENKNENLNENIKENTTKFFFFTLKTIGRLIILYENEQGIIYVMGHLFPCIFMINLLINIFILCIVYKNIPTIFKMVGSIINFIQIYLFIYSSTKNPGLPLKEYGTLIYEEENKNAKNFRQCKDCKFWINTDEKTIHCRKCQICIEGYDHHCDCMNICIGKNNLKSFYFLILVSFILVIYSILVTLAFK